MAYKKKEIPEKVQAKKKPVAKKKAVEEVKKVAKPRLVKKAKTRYRSVHRDLYHPFQLEMIPMHPTGVELELDNWLECQINAGLVAKVE